MKKFHGGFNERVSTLYSMFISYSRIERVVTARVCARSQNAVNKRYWQLAIWTPTSWTPALQPNVCICTFGILPTCWPRYKLHAGVLGFCVVWRITALYSEINWLCNDEAEYRRLLFKNLLKEVKCIYASFSVDRQWLWEVLVSVLIDYLLALNI